MNADAPGGSTIEDDAPGAPANARSGLIVAAVADDWTVTALVTRARNGDKRAWDELVDRSRIGGSRRRARGAGSLACAADGTAAHGRNRDVTARPARSRADGSGTPQSRYPGTAGSRGR